MVSKALVVFDYKELDKEAAGKLRCIAAEIKRATGQHQKSGLAIGQSIAQAHAVLATDGKEGQFSAWVESECGFGRTTAYNYMWSWERFGECEAIGQFDQGAMYALASPKVAPAAVAEAEKLADKGQRITAEKAKEILGKFRMTTRKPKQTASNKGVNGPIVQPLNNSTPEPAPDSIPPGNCPKGGDHTFVDGECSKCLHPEKDTKPAKPEPAKPAEPPVNKFLADVAKAEENETPHRESFKKLKEHIRQVILLLDVVHNETGKKWQEHDKCHVAIDVVSVAVHKFAKACK